MAAVPEGGGLVWSDKIDARVGFDFLFKTHGPVGPIDDKSAVIGV